MKKLIILISFLLILSVVASACESAGNLSESQEETTSAAVSETEDKDTDTTEENKEDTPGETEETEEETPAEKRIITPKTIYNLDDQIRIIAYGSEGESIGIVDVKSNELLLWWSFSSSGEYKSIKSGVRFDVRETEANGGSAEQLTKGDYIIFLYSAENPTVGCDFVDFVEISIIGNEEEDSDKEPVDPEEGYPTWGSRRDLVTHHIFDGAKRPTGGSFINNGTTVVVTEAIDAVVYHGWIGAKGEIGCFGYVIGDGEEVFNDEWTSIQTSGAVHSAAISTGADTAARMAVAIPIGDLEGKVTVKVLYKAENGDIVCLNTLSIDLTNREEVDSSEETEKPEVPETDSYPMWSAKKNIITHHAFDGLTKPTGSFVNGGTTVVVPNGVDTLIYHGWVGIKGEIGCFGYKIGNEEAVFNDVWANLDVEDAVLNGALGTGADTAARTRVNIPTSGLEGKVTVKVLYRSADGQIVCLNNITLDMTQRVPEANSYPMYNTRLDVITHYAYDGITKVSGDSEEMATGDSFSFEPSTVDAIIFRGWVGVKGEFGRYGYQIGDEEAVFNDEWTAIQTSGAVYNAAISTGADVAARMSIKVPIAGIEGKLVVKALYQLSDGEIVCLKVITLNISENDAGSGESEEIEMPNPENIPMWRSRRDIVTHHAYDGLAKHAGGAIINNGTSVVLTEALNEVIYAGWVGVKGEVGCFGYQIGSEKAVFNDAWTHLSISQAVHNAAMSTGADNAARMNIAISLEGVSGEITVRALYKSTSGEIVCLGVVTIKLP